MVTLITGMGSVLSKSLLATMKHIDTMEKFQAQRAYMYWEQQKKAAEEQLKEEAKDVVRQAIDEVIDEFNNGINRQ